MISGEIYKKIADLVTSIQDRGLNITENITLMSTLLYDNDVWVYNVDKEWLYKIINSNYNKFYNAHYLKSTQIQDFVKSLQKYVTTEYGSVDSFLEDNNLQVFVTFAQISEMVGYIIDPSHIYKPSIS